MELEKAFMALCLHVISQWNILSRGENGKGGKLLPDLWKNVQSVLVSLLSSYNEHYNSFEQTHTWSHIHMITIRVEKALVQARSGSTHLLSQHLRGRGMRTTINLRAALSTDQVPVSQGFIMRSCHKQTPRKPVCCSSIVIRKLFSNLGMQLPGERACKGRHTGQTPALWPQRPATLHHGRETCL